ncbi:MAG TPA: hypothetical protein PKD90_02500 [Phnomibacter sp.]|nr:hypothetical protein [Phnomibacter sp.]
MKSNNLKIFIGIFTFWVMVLPATAQDTSRRKTIEITSTFKPSLLPQDKIVFTASPAPADTTRPVFQYNLPSQNLAMRFTPATLRPLAYEADSALLKENTALLKLGYGNYQTPFIRALATFGNGIKSSGSLEADYTGSKGNLPLQQYQQYGAKAHAWINTSPNHTFRVNGGFDGLHTYQYGYRPQDKPVDADSLKLRYTHLYGGAGLANKNGGDAQIYYDGQVAAHLFNDNRDGREATFNFNLPVQMPIGEHAMLQVGIKGMVSRFNGEKNQFTNNLFQLPVGASVVLNENLNLKGLLIPSWSNKQFKLLPDIGLEYKMEDNNLVLQAGVKGSYAENTFRTLVNQNPWVQQPDTLLNTRQMEVFAAIKSMVSEAVSFRAKLGVGKLYDVPLFVNSGTDGRVFQTLWEPTLNLLSLSGEFVYQPSEQLFWSNTLTINSYSQLKQYDKAFGLLPVELRSSLRYMITKELALKADLYQFSGPYYREQNGSSKRGKAALDLNAGLEYAFKERLSFWLQFNNIINQDYQRWNQYQVLGFQALGGVIVKL